MSNSIKRFEILSRPQMRWQRRSSLKFWSKKKPSSSSENYSNTCLHTSQCSILRGGLFIGLWISTAQYSTWNNKRSGKSITGWKMTPRCIWKAAYSILPPLGWLQKMLAHITLTHCSCGRWSSKASLTQLQMSLLTSCHGVRYGTTIQSYHCVEIILI